MTIVLLNYCSKSIVVHLCSTFLLSASFSILIKIYLNFVVLEFSIKFSCAKNSIKEVITGSFSLLSIRRKVAYTLKFQLSSVVKTNQQQYKRIYIIQASTVSSENTLMRTDCFILISSQSHHNSLRRNTI